MDSQWYPVVAAILAVLIQLFRKLRLTAWLWQRLPEGARFVIPLLSGAVAGFLAAYEAGEDWRHAILAAAVGAIGIGATASGIHAWLKESPLPVDGGAGGHRRQQVILPPPRPVHIRFPREDDEADK